MGAGPSESKLKSWNEATADGAQKRLGKTFLARWQKRQLVSQFFGVVRHAERADGIWAFYRGQRWTQTDDFRNWPVDPPLSDAGMEAAGAIGQNLQALATGSATSIHVVVTSPYFRCVQTAVEICRVLGRGARLMVDWSLGEVFGPSVLGETEPSQPVRPAEETQAFCRSRGVKCISKTVGQWPRWPEDLGSARQRYASRFLTYLQRGAMARRNFLLVTHGDCVGAALSLMPTQAGSIVESVEFGGLFVASRCCHASCGEPPAASRPTRPAGRRKSLRGKFSSICPTMPEGDEVAEGVKCSWDNEACEEPNSPTDWGKWPRSACRAPMASSWLEAPGLSASSKHSELAGQLEPPMASDGWDVLTHDVALRQKPGSKACVGGKIKKRVQTLTKHTRFSQEQIEKLLGCMIARPLGSGEKELQQGPATPVAAEAQRSTSFSHASTSTILFGGSRNTGSFNFSCLSDGVTVSRSSSLADFSPKHLDALLVDELPEGQCGHLQHTSSESFGWSWRIDQRRPSARAAGTPPRSATLPRHLGERALHVAIDDSDFLQSSRSTMSPRSSTSSSSFCMGSRVVDTLEEQQRAFLGALVTSAAELRKRCEAGAEAATAIGEFRQRTPSMCDALDLMLQKSPDRQKPAGARSVPPRARHELPMDRSSFPSAPRRRGPPQPALGEPALRGSPPERRRPAEAFAAARTCALPGSIAEAFAAARMCALPGSMTEAPHELRAQEGWRPAPSARDQWSAEPRLGMPSASEQEAPRDLTPGDSERSWTASPLCRRQPQAAQPDLPPASAQEPPAGPTAAPQQVPPNSATPALGLAAPCGSGPAPAALGLVAPCGSGPAQPKAASKPQGASTLLMRRALKPLKLPS
mmetsp:Transcript_110880/g.357954  ORF Transcript_110880/g.357954 Transcript_110880/m.357954 type:complete len:869 (+) Transcript_110880:83-2689(+)